MASSTRSALISKSLPSTGLNSTRPSRLTVSTLVGVQRRDAAAPVAVEALRGDGVQPLAAFLVRRRDAEDVRPQRPRVVGRARVGRPRQQLELTHGERALPVRGAEAVGAGVAAADDDDVLVLRGDEAVVRDMPSPSLRRFCSGRYSIAKWMPSRSRPGTGRSRGVVEPPASTIASNSRRRSSTATSTPTWQPVRKMTPSSSSSASRRSSSRFSSLNSGMP